VVAGVAGDYFKAMEIPLLRGRFFADADSEEAPRVFIINQALARRYWPEEDAIGKRITKGGANPRWITIVGVVGDIRHKGLDVEAKPEFYFPHAQYPNSSMILTTRTSSSPRTIAAAIRQEVQKLDKDQSVANVRTLQQVISDSVTPRRLAAVMLGIFASIALALASVGIYGVLSYLVTQRKVRGLRLIHLGMGVGLAASFIFTNFLESMLFGVRPTDLLTFVFVSVLLMSVGLFAPYIPARHAAAVDPNVSLRCE